MKKEDLNVQCFAKRNTASVFSGDNDPELLYVSHVTPSANVHPRMLHSHKHHLELLLICDGESDFVIQNKKAHVKKGDLVVYNQGVVHDDMTGTDTNLDYYCVGFGNLKMPDLSENAFAPDESKFVFACEDRFEDMRLICEMMFSSLSLEETNAEIYCNSLLRALLTKALCIVSAEEAETEFVIEENLIGDRVKEYIDGHYMEPVTLQDIGDALRISPYYLSHVFKKASGYSPIQYLLRRRLGEAQTLLISTDTPIADIAGMVGFDTQNYFNAQFTKHVGMPPKKYRESYVVSVEKKKKKTEGK